MATNQAGDFDFPTCQHCGRATWACQCFSQLKTWPNYTQTWSNPWQYTQNQWQMLSNQVQQGWQCPICKTVYSPWHSKCECAVVEESSESGS